MKTLFAIRPFSLVVLLVINLNFVQSISSFASATKSSAVKSIGFDGEKIFKTLIFSEKESKKRNSEFSFTLVSNTEESTTIDAFDIKANNTVQLVAEPFLGYVFRYWTIDDIKMSESIVFEFLMPEKDVSVAAHYDPVSPPTVQIISPIENSVYKTGDSIEINIDASSYQGEIEKIQLFVNEILVTSIFELPYSFDFINYPEGNYFLKAVATDNTGQISTSEIANFSIENPNVGPTATITSPAANAQFIQGDDAVITANAVDSDGTIDKVEFYDGNILLGTDTTFPFSFTWTNLAIGSFSLTAKATDNEGAVEVSSSVNISVIEKVTEVNPIEVIIAEPIIVTPVNNQEYEAGVTVQVLVMFQGSDESVKKVEYYSGSEIIGSSVISPFAFTWLNPAPGKHVLTAKAIGSDQSNFKVSESINILVKEKTQTIFEIYDPIRDSEFYQGSKITIRVNIPESSKPISRVEYFRGNVRIGTSTSAPYDYTWNNAHLGNHILVAQLTYVDGTKILSNPVPIKVLKKNQSVVKLFSQNNKREVRSGENLDLNVELIEFENKVESVEYILNGEKLGSSENQPYGFQWKNIPEGDHELIAHAVDAIGLSYYSEPVTISVKKDVKDVRLEYVIGPNPTTEYLNVIFTNLDGIYDFEFRVVSMNGMVQKTFKTRPEDSAVTIDVSDMRNGVYVLQLTANGNEISSRRFIKK
jgi:hypothetical protein